MTDTYSPIPELNLLREFDDSHEDAFTAWWGLDEYGHMEFLEDEPELRHGLIRFAQANGSGSLYALWRLDDRADLSTLPVVLLGDEGGIHLVARTLREFFQLLGALDEDLACDEEEVFASGPTEPLPARDAYLAWLEQNFGLAPADDVDSVITAAQAELGERFEAWLAAAAQPRH